MCTWNHSFLSYVCKYAQDAVLEKTVMRVLSHNSPILLVAHMQLYTRKGKSLIVEQSFGVQVDCIRCTVF